jgi:3-oxoadipate enol-lactonase
MPFVDIEDSRVEYRVEGHGPGMILVHGAGRDADNNWGQLAAGLAGHRTVIRPNYSGSGGTVDRGGPLTLERLERQVVASGWAVGAVPFDLVGHGLGAAVATYVAATMPDLVRSLVLVGASVDANDPVLRHELRLRRDLLSSDPELLARYQVLADHAPAYLAQFSDPEIEQRVAELRNSIDSNGMTRQLNLELGVDLNRLLPGITCPTAVVACEHDRTTPPTQAAALAAAIPDAGLIRIGTGRLAAVEQPEALAALIEKLVLKARAVTA